MSFYAHSHRQGIDVHEHSGTTLGHGYATQEATTEKGLGNSKSSLTVSVILLAATKTTTATKTTATRRTNGG